MGTNDIGALDLPRRSGRRQRVAELQARMLRFSAVYNAATVLRDAWHGSAGRRHECVVALAAVVARELQQTQDPEALLYALADSLYCSPHGVPWEA
jgi:hypothetical protein